jgi:hypothetical protein
MAWFLLNQACPLQRRAGGSDRVNELHLPPNVFFEVQREGVGRWKAVISHFRILIAAAVARSP